MKRKTKKTKSKLRNTLAIVAHFRNSAGSMKDKKKEASKKNARIFKHKKKAD